MALHSARENRRMTFIKAFLAVGEGWVEVTISNISPHGMMVKCNEPPALGTVVTIRRRAAGVTGTVVWANGRRFGLRSDEPIDQEAFGAESAADAHRREKPVVARPRLADRFWHWRSQD